MRRAITTLFALLCSLNMGSCDVPPPVEVSGYERAEGPLALITCPSGSCQERA